MLMSNNYLLHYKISISFPLPIFSLLASRYRVGTSLRTNMTESQLLENFIQISKKGFLLPLEGCLFCGGEMLSGFPDLRGIIRGRWLWRFLWALHVFAIQFSPAHLSFLRIQVLRYHA